jgi:phage replication-related protein YjqB (UPF0714/DUF867 family)
MTFDGTVSKAFSSQSTLMRQAEHCSMDPERLTAAGLAIGRQVRVKRGASDVALYTVSEDRHETVNTTIRMALPARVRLLPPSEDDEFAVTVDTQVPHPSLSDEEAQRQSELVERLTDDGAQANVVALAPHGGAIERETDRQAERVAQVIGAARASVWLCKGYKKGGGASRQWHITASDLDDLSFPLLGSIARRGFAHAVAFHGFSEADVLVGGGAPRPLKRRIATELQRALAGTDIQVRIARGSEDVDGNNPRNIVNRLTEGGIGGVQIEQSLEARDKFWEPIADAVARVFLERLGAA